MFLLSSETYVGGGVKIGDIIKTLCFNFRYFPFSIAKRLPVFIRHNVEVRYMKRGNISFVGTIRPFMLSLGSIDREYTYDKPSMINIKGSMVVKGNGYHAFAPGIILYVGENATLEVGNNFSVSHDAKFYIKKSCVIGDDNMWSYYNVIMDNDAHPIYDPSGNLLNYNKDVIIGNHVWIGCRCTIMKGAEIPNDSIIGSNSIVNKQMNESNCIYAGNPVRQIKQNVDWNNNLL